MKKLILLICFTTLLVPFPVSAEVLETIDAIVNGELILSGEVDEFLKMRIGANVNNLPEERILAERRTLIREMIDEMLIVQEARKRFNEAQRNDIAAKIEQITNLRMDQFRQQFSTPEDLAREEQRTKLSWDDRRRAFARQSERNYLRKQVLLMLVRQKITRPTLQDLETFKKNFPQVKPNDEITIARILLRIPPNASSDRIQQIENRAREVMLRARGNEPFDRLALEFSEHEETRVKGGELPPFKKGEFVDEFDVLFGKSEGYISDLIRMKDGFHIIKILNVPSYEDLYLQIQQRQIQNDWLIQEQKKANIEIRHDEELMQEFATLKNAN